MNYEEQQSKLESLQKEYSNTKKYLEWCQVLSIYGRNEDISLNLGELKNHLETQVLKLEKEIPEIAVKLKNLDKKTTSKNKKNKTATNISKEKDYQSIENLKFVYENHKRIATPILYHPQKGVLIVKSVNQVTLYSTLPENIFLKGKTFHIKDTPATKEVALVQSPNLNLNQIKEALKEDTIGFSFDLTELDLKFCLVIGRI